MNSVFGVGNIVIFAEGADFFDAASPTLYEPGPIDKVELISMLKRFSKLPSEPRAMDTDENFIENLEFNLNLCESADRIRFWVDDAVSRGFMPEDYDMEELQTKLAGLDDVKKYIYNQKELMKNPYYFYLAKNDVSYTEPQLDRLIQDVNSETLKGYLTGLRNIRGLDYVRREGMDSIEKRA